MAQMPFSPLRNPSSLLSSQLCSASAPCGPSAGIHEGKVAERRRADGHVTEVVSVLLLPVN